jgi:hypothetical protein
LPTTCIHRCSVAYVSFHSSYGRGGHDAVTRRAYHAAMTNTVDQQARFALTMFATTQQYMDLSPAALDAAIRLLDAGTQIPRW